VTGQDTRAGFWAERGNGVVAVAAWLQGSAVCMAADIRCLWENGGKIVPAMCSICSQMTRTGLLRGAAAVQGFARPWRRAAGKRWYLDCGDLQRVCDAGPSDLCSTDPPVVALLH
jgi:hypothetical protein